MLETSSCRNRELGKERVPTEFSKIGRIEVLQQNLSGLAGARSYYRVSQGLRRRSCAERIRKQALGVDNLVGLVVCVICEINCNLGF